MEWTAEVLSRKVISVSPETTIKTATQIMRQNSIGCVPVAAGGKLIGMFSERDVVNRVVSQGVDPATTEVQALMTDNPISIDASEPLKNVFSLLAQRRFRHVPITKDGVLVGIISLTDLAGVLTEAFKEQKYLQFFLDYLTRGRSIKA